MKRVGYLIEDIADCENIRLAFWKARKGKPYSTQVEEYRKHLDSNILKLRNELLQASIGIGNYHYFKIYDPKERDICASTFEERVLHHAIMNICHPYFDQFMIYDSYASRPGKGVHAALDRAKELTKRYQWFLKLDVKQFFASIHHEVLKNQLERRFKDLKLLSIFDQIIDSYATSPKRGLPIGNLSSQYFANHYLAELDHFIKEQLKCKAYIRYMDDMVLWSNHKKDLKIFYKAIKEYIEKQLLCELKPLLLNATIRGLPFCGYVIRPNHVRLSKNSKKRFIRKLKNRLYSKMVM